MIPLACLVSGVWIDVDTGEEVDPIREGVIYGYELYGYIASRWPTLRAHEGRRRITFELGNGWKLWTPGRRESESKLHLYFYGGSIKGYGGKGGHRPAIKCTVWNGELFTNNPNEDTVKAAKRLRKLCEDKGIKPTATPGGMGKAIIKVMSEWRKDRYFAPPWVSEIAREHLPGNHYAIREDFRKSKDILLIDAQASHHNIANSIPLPHPQSVRRRGARTPGKNRQWILAKDIGLLKHQWGLLHALVEVDTIPREHIHLYPKWAWEPGIRLEWIWTPELRLLDRRVRLVSVQSALTGGVVDTALWEYADFALDQIRTDPHPIIKPVLHSAYGGLAVRKYNELRKIILGDTGKHKHVREIRLPWIDDIAHEVTVKGVKISPLQNVVAYGVIGAEQTVRSLELARKYEWEYKLHVVQVYADALLVRTKQVPFTPPGWEVKADLGEVTAAMPNQIISTRLLRIPGMHGGRRRAVYLEKVKSLHDQLIEHPSSAAIPASDVV